MKFPIGALAEAVLTEKKRTKDDEKKLAKQILFTNEIKVED